MFTVSSPPDGLTLQTPEPITKLPAVQIDCSMPASALKEDNLVVNCPPGCDKKKGTVYGNGIMTDHSSVCHSAILTGVIDPESGGNVAVKMLPGQVNYGESENNGVKSYKHGGWPKSFKVSKPQTDKSFANVPKEEPGRPGEPGKYGESEEPEEPGKSKRPEKFNESGKSPESGEVEEPKKAVETGKYNDPGEYPNKPIQPLKWQEPENYDKARQSEEPEKPKEIWKPNQSGKSPDSEDRKDPSMSKVPTHNSQLVDDDCTKTGEHLPDGISKLLCLRECVTAKMDIWGTDNYTEDSLACKAATHAGALPITGGMAEVEKLPGLPKYDGSTRNDITSKKYGTWSRSLVFRKPSSKISETPSKLPDFSSSKPTEPESPSKQPTGKISHS
uniref:LCCL domain-containing protein n=1 Tax=Leptobrachium leishanense TaxID=445787 RepID=A0A8C5R906_9ANUR